MRRIWLMLVPLVAAACTGGDDRATSSSVPESATEATTVPESEPGVAPDGDAPGELLLPELDDVGSAEWTPATRTEEILVELSELQEPPSAQLAIDALALAVAGVPGATPSDLQPGDGVGEVTLRRMIESARSVLVGEQADVVDEFLGEATVVATLLDDGTVRFPVGPTTTNSAPGDATSTSDVTTTSEAPVTTAAGFRRPTSTPADEFEKYVASLAYANDLWDQHLPTHPVLGQVDLVFTDSGFDRMGANTGADSTTCRIEVPKGYRDRPYSDLENQFIFAHELFHCFQFRWAGGNLWIADWLVEGSAQWATIDLFRTIPFPHEKWYDDRWFTSAQTPLSARAYDAWPLYENARLTGMHPYESIRKMFESPTSFTGPLLAVGGLDGAIFRKDWSSRTLRSDPLGSAWQLPWPVVQTGAGPHENALTTTRGVGTYHVVGAGSYTQLQQDVLMTTDVGLVVVTPQGGPLTTWTALGTVTVEDGTSRRFCFDPGGCACPGDSTSDAIPMDGLDMLFSYPAALKGVTSTVVASPWDPDDRCRDLPKGKDGTSNGDPHLYTFDGIAYDVMTLGEFVTARDPAGGLEVQTRHAAFDAGAGTTAVAIGTGTSRVTVTMPGFDQFSDPVVRVDGEPATEASFEVDGVEFSVDIVGVEARWLDGSTVTMNWFMGWFVLIDAPPDRAARMEGLLGSGDDDLSNDLRFPDGTLTDTSEVEHDESEFVLAWAVDESTTLFDYEPGQSVATFRIPHPDPEPVEPSPDVVDACEAALGESAAAHDVSSCAFDVSATGEDEFIGAYVEVVEHRITRTDEPTVVIVPPDEPTPSTAPGSVAESQAGEPTLVLTADRPAGVASIAEGSVLVARSRGCPGEVGLSVQVTRVGSPDDLAVATLCDPSGVGGILAGNDDEWFDGEAYVWIPGSGEYEVAVTTIGFDPDADLLPIDVYTDPTPTVLDRVSLTGGDERTLTGIADTVVYLTDPGAVLDATGFDRACAVAIYWTKTFPDPEPFAMGACEHATTIDFPPTDSVFPTVVFARTEAPIAVSLSPR